MQFKESDLILNRDGSVYHLSLRPKHVSNKIIVVGDPGRVHRVSRHFDEIEFEMNKREFITHTGFYKGKRITVMSTGMGTDNIEIVMMELDALFNIDLKKRATKRSKKSFEIVRIGTSGAIQDGIKTGTIIASNYCIGLDTTNQYYEVPQNDFENDICRHLKEALTLPNIPYCVHCSNVLRKRLAFDLTGGNTVTTPGFYGPQGRNLRIPLKNQALFDQILYFNYNDFWLSNFEMESSALYGLAKLLGHQALSINAILANRVNGTFLRDSNKLVDTIIEKVLERF
jgi:uridine phosphorylase